MYWHFYVKDTYVNKTPGNLVSPAVVLLFARPFDEVRMNCKIKYVA